MWPRIVRNFFVIKPTRCINFTNLFCHETTCFGQFVCPSSAVYSLYTQQWYMSYRFVDSFRAGAYANTYESSNQQEACLYLGSMGTELQAATTSRIAKLQLTTYPSKDFPIFNSVSFPARQIFCPKIWVAGTGIAGTGIWPAVDGASVGHKWSRLGPTGWGPNDPDCDVSVLSLLHRNTADIGKKGIKCPAMSI